ncbi:CaiB/BaiF CoA transferase family protein [Homoserinimonas sp. A520]
MNSDNIDMPRPGPLSGIVVADFTRVLAGPYCTMLLADMGATVIKVESPDGDDTRTWKPPLRDGESTYFLSINRNKRSIILDLRDEDDLVVARQLARQADVLVENFKADGLRRFGLDYSSVSATNPSLIYTSITGFGPGAGAEFPGYDLTVQALSGMMSLTGGEDTGPYRVGVALFDVMTGLHAAMGILGALHHRTATGEGQLLELNLLTSALSSMVNQTSAWVAGGVVPTRMGNEHPSLYPYEPFPTGDGDLVVAVGNNGQFARLCSLLGLDGVATDERFSTTHARNDNRIELRSILVGALAAHSASHWFDALSAIGVPCAPIQDVRQGVELAERLGLDPVAVAGSGDRAIPTVRHPVSYSRTPASYDIAPPILGADTVSVKRWLDARDTPTKENL